MKFRNPSVRFMVMERIDEDLYGFTRRKSPSVKESLELVRGLIVGLQTMHAHEIVHGDIHPGNLGFLEGRLVMFDFGSAFFIEETIGLSARLYRSGFRFGKRDDVFKAVMVGAFSMNKGQLWINYCTNLESDGPAMMKFKRESFLFEIPGISSLAKLPPATNAVVRQRLTHILRLARIPEYTGIIAQIDAIVALLEQ